MSELMYQKIKFVPDIEIYSALERKNIAFTGTIDYLPWIAVSMTSIILHNKAMKICFHLFLNKLSEESRIKLREFAKKWNIPIYVYIMNDAMLLKFSAFQRYQIQGNYIPAFIYRFFIPDILYNIADRILYLDGDVLCNGSIQKLLDVDLSENIIAASEDLKSQEYAARLHIQRYFNSGVLLIDIRKWHLHSISEQLTKEIEKNIESGIDLPCPDQDILNILLHEKTLFVDQCYNLPYRLVQPSLIKPKIINENPESASLIHFIGAIKPWTNYNQSVPIVKAWAEAKANSPWLDEPLHKPQSQKALHQAARDWRRQKKWMAMMKAYGCFFYSKFNGTQKNGY